ncbi:MSCRAMM family protein [Steroidobacter cummioxidans]|uniref:MSCRAMM family protein n=1 Tax=Steroidobacter cummioxidans TaxID=1803913 RepID=UPI000E31E270|nr:carboxypeptidase-like regulatory domain-containing protein [Steroidobacter cummioxidans]
MELLRRLRLAASLILVGVLALLGWQLLPETLQPTTPDTQQQALPTPPPSAEAPSSASSAVIPAPAAEAPVANVLRGRAFDAVTGEPVTRFEIVWRQPREERWQFFKSRERTFETTDGRFEYTDVLPGKWIVTVTARGYQRFELPDIRITTGPQQELLLPLQKGHAVRGRVYDEATDAGIAAGIDVLNPTASMALRGTGGRSPNKAGEDGSFLIDSVAPGRTTLVVEAKNYTTRTVLVEVGPNTPSLQIGLSAGGVIAGRFTTGAGKPIGNGLITLYRSDGVIAGTHNTGPAGTFEFRGLDDAKYQIAGRHGSAIITQDVVLRGSAANIQLALKAGRILRGKVTGLRSELLDKVSISVLREGENMYSHNRVDSRGEFELNDVAPGPVRVVADVNRTREVSKAIEMPADADITVNLDFPPGASLSGRMTRNNKPLADFDFFVRPPDSGAMTGWHRVKTSAAGTYTVSDMEPGEYVAIAGSFVSKPVQVNNQAIFDIELSGGDLTGRTLDEAGSAPMAGALVDIDFVEGESPPIRLHALSDALGQFKIASVVPAEYTLTVYKPGYRLYRERIVFDPQSDAPVVLLRQDPGVEIRGRDAAGKPVREIMLMETVGGRNGIFTNLQLDENGVGYLPSGLAGSHLQLVARGAGMVEISSWDGAALDLRFETFKKQ